MRRALCLLAVTGALVAAMIAALSGTAASAAPAVSVFPLPGTQYAEPGEQIVFRGIPASDIGKVSVVGSVTGKHSGHIAADSDGEGGSFLPDAGFAPGETVTVTTGLNVVGANNGAWQFKIGTPFPPIKMVPVAHVPGGVQHFHSRPDLQPSTIRVLKKGARPRQGDIFVDPQYGPVQDGPMLIDTSGNLVWFHPVPKGDVAADFRVQKLGSQSVLTWWQGWMSNGSGRGQDIIFNTNYQEIHAVNVGNGLQGADLHEFLLTPQGDAYIVAVYPLQWPGTRKPLMDSVVQEIDVNTGLVLFEWDALDHVPLTESFYKTPAQPGHVWDPYHINSIALAHDGNLILSMRDTWAVYKVNHSSGALMWTLGSNQSTFKMGAGTRTAFQHDVQMTPNGNLTMFDDGAGPPRKEGQSRAIRVALSWGKKTATLVQQDVHQPGLSSNYEGNLQLLGDGDWFVGWGQQSYFTEFNSKGQMDFDAQFGGGVASYRAYRYPWAAQPPTLPAIAVSRGSHGVSTVYASWNGDTTAAAYRVLGGSSPSHMSRLRIVVRRGFETALVVHNTSKYFEVQALGAKSKVLATSSAAT